MVTLAQAMKELEKLQRLHERRPGGKLELSEVEVARTICFVINRDSWGQATPAQTRQAQQLHFALYGTPEIDLSKFGPRAVRRIVCLDGGKPNQGAPVDVVDPRVLYLYDNGKAPAAQPYHPRHSGKEQR